MTARTTTERVKAFRERKKDELGLVRLEIYLHPDDHQEIKSHVWKLNKSRLETLILNRQQTEESNGSNEENAAKEDASG